MCARMHAHATSSVSLQNCGKLKTVFQHRIILPPYMVIWTIITLSFWPPELQTQSHSWLLLFQSHMPHGVISTLSFATKREDPENLHQGAFADHTF